AGSDADLRYAKPGGVGDCGSIAAPEDDMAKRTSAAINVVVDLSHHNGDVDLQQAATGGGILGVIHKATQGLTYTDPLYEENRDKASAAKLLWGAYHFGT